MLGGLRTPRRWTHPWFTGLVVRCIAILALCLLLGACASGSEASSSTVADETSAGDTPASETSGTSAGDAETPVASSDAGSTEGGSTEAADDSEEAVADVFISPIGEALGVAQEDLTVAFDTYVNDAELLVRECMVEAGFDYQPVTSGIDRATRRQFELEQTLTFEQFRREYGYGIATLFELNFEGQGVVDFVNQQFGPAPTEERSSSEQEAYEIALNGESTQGLTAEEAQEQIFGGDVGSALEGSCRDYGYSTAVNPGSVYDGLFSILGDEMESLFDRFDSDPRVRDAMAQWQSCIAARGHSYEDENEVIEELIVRTDDLANQFLSSPQVLEALGQAQQQGFVAMNDEDRIAFLEEIGALQGFAWVPEVQAQVDELVAFELQIAADSQECGNDELFQQVQVELETEFVEAHAEQLALIAAGDS